MDCNFQTERDFVAELLTLIRTEKDDAALREALSDYHESDIADAFEAVDEPGRERLRRVLDAETFSEVFAYVENAEKYIEEMSPREAAELLENMDSDDAIDILDEMDDDTEEKLIRLMDAESQSDISLLRSYEENEIGSYMTTNFVSIRKDLTVKQAMKSLIEQAGENDNITMIYVCDENDRFYGAITLKDLIVAREQTELESLIRTSYPFVTDHEDISTGLEHLREYSEDSFPVLNADGQLLGIITAQDIIEAVDDEMGDDYAKLAGLTEESDLEETIFSSIKKRIPWLLILLVLGIGVSTVVGVFEGVVSQIALIVCFQSLVLDMAGNVGTQSLAVTIRVLMDEGLQTKQKFKLVWKEVRIGVCNGLLLGLLSTVFIGLYITLFKGYDAPHAFAISGCVGIALLVAMLISSLVGTTVPMLFHKIGVDPAVASGPLITTVNDLVAVVTYYGLAWILLIDILHITR